MKSISCKPRLDFEGFTLSLIMFSDSTMLGKNQGLNSGWNIITFLTLSLRNIITLRYHSLSIISITYKALGISDKIMKSLNIITLRVGMLLKSLSIITRGKKGLTLSLKKLNDFNNIFNYH